MFVSSRKKLLEHNINFKNRRVTYFKVIYFEVTEAIRVLNWDTRICLYMSLTYLYTFSYLVINSLNIHIGCQPYLKREFAGKAFPVTSRLSSDNVEFTLLMIERENTTELTPSQNQGQYPVIPL